mgnify:CR=1 FL=1
MSDWFEFVQAIYLLYSIFIRLADYRMHRLDTWQIF